MNKLQWQINSQSVNEVEIIKSTISKVELSIDYQDDRETCLWIPSDCINDSKITVYVNSARNKGCNEEKSLQILMQNGYNSHTALTNIEIAVKSKSIHDLDPINVSNEFAKIISKKKRGRYSRRCFNRIHLEFTDYPMGQILDFYMRNKLKIKRKVAKDKKKIKKLQALPSETELKLIIDRIKPENYECEIILDDDTNDDDCIIVKEFNQIDEGWTARDCTLLCFGLNDYGYDYSKLSIRVGTKTEAMIKNFIHQHIYA